MPPEEIKDAQNLGGEPGGVAHDADAQTRKQLGLDETGSDTGFSGVTAEGERVSTDQALDKVRTAVAPPSGIEQEREPQPPERVVQPGSTDGVSGAYVAPRVNVDPIVMQDRIATLQDDNSKLEQRVKDLEAELETNNVEMTTARQREDLLAGQVSDLQARLAAKENQGAPHKLEDLQPIADLPKHLSLDETARLQREAGGGGMGGDYKL